MGHPFGCGRSWRSALGAVATVALAVGGVACSSDDDAAPAGDVVGEGDRYEATIRRTDGGVPHITGDSIADVTFGQGWASGEDHACDLADQVLKVRGERARWLGPGGPSAWPNGRRPTGPTPPTRSSS
jgi:acyl-homoserine-lactone acylase